MKRSLKIAARALLAIAAIPILAGCWTLEYSPDGSKIVFLWGEPNSDKTTLGVINIDGTGFRYIPGATESMFGHWSPNGEKIAFSSETGLQVYDLRTNKTTLVRRGMCLDSAWIDDKRMIVDIDVDPKSVDGSEARLAWIDVASGAQTQSIPLKESADEVMHLKPVPRTEGAIFIGANDLYLAEFGEIAKLTTTGDVIGYDIAADGNRVVYARRTKNAQFYLMSIYELNLKLRTGKRLGNLQNVPGINPKPRTGPVRIEFVQFANDFREMLVFAISAEKNSHAKVYNELYMVRVDGSGARKVLGLGPEEDGVMAALSPDGKNVAALYGDEKTLSLTNIDVQTGAKRIVRTMLAPQKAKKP